MLVGGRSVIVVSEAGRWEALMTMVRVLPHAVVEIAEGERILQACHYMEEYSGEVKAQL